MASRLENSARNVLVAWGGQIFSILLAFVSRGVFAYQLSMDYMGLENLFSNLLSVLALADLGVGTAITFSLYKPLAENDRAKVKALMRLFRKAYFIIGITIGLAGFAIAPFVQVFIKDAPDVPYLNFYFLMFVLNTAVSYFFSYKGSLIAADQKKYIVSLIQYGFQGLMSIAQIVVLIATQNYFLFLVCMLASTLIQNIIIARTANKMYPYILGKDADLVDKETVSQIKKNTFALVLHRIATIASTPTSSLILSSFVGIQSIAIYGNYMLVINSLGRVIDQTFDAVVASLGNLGVSETGERQYEVFQTAFFINAFLCAMVCVPLVCLFNSLVGEFWLGSDYLFPFSIVCLLVLLFYLKGMRSAALSFTSAYGLYWYTRWKAVIETIVLLSLSIFLVMKLEVAGVVLAGIISTSLVSSIYEGYMLFKHGFKRPSRFYFRKFYFYVAVTLVIAIAGLMLCSLVPLYGIAGFAIKLVISLLVPFLSFCLFFHRTREFKEAYSMVSRVAIRLFKKSKRDA